MANNVTPYVQVNPGDLITADLFNTVQEDVKTDIVSQIKGAVDGLTTIKHADDATTLGGLSLKQLSDQIADQVLAKLARRTGYMMTFRKLVVGREKIIKHNLAQAPVVDVLQLDYFPVACGNGDSVKDAVVKYSNFFLYHATERTIFNAGANLQKIVVEDPVRQPQFKIPFLDLLKLYEVKYTPDTALDDLEVAFWSALFKTPDDQPDLDPIDSDEYCSSPWFRQCCGENRSVKDLQTRGDLDNLFLKMVPRKTINFPAQFVGAVDASFSKPTSPESAPTQLQVVHFNFNAIGVTLISEPIYPPDPTAPKTDVDFKYPEDHVKAMVLMKV